MTTFRTSTSRTLSYRQPSDRERGGGPLVVMLPGGPGMDPESYFAGTDLPGLRRLIFCPRGTGESDPPSTPDGYRIGGYVQDLEELRRHLGVPALLLYGSSHGASTALCYAARHPGRVQRMVLANGPARLDNAYRRGLTSARDRFDATAPDGAERLGAADAAFHTMRTTGDEPERRTAFRTLMNRYVAQLGRRETDFLDRLCAAPMNFAAAGPMVAEMSGGLDLLRDAHTITAPTLVIGAELDTQVPAEHMRVIADTVPGARLVEFEESGHLVETEQPARWAELVGGFFRD